MGKELVCTVRYGGQESEGKALLETSEVLFRGEFRLKIAFREMKSVRAVNGELRIRFPDGRADFVLGAQAEKWAHKILHPKTVIEKLGVMKGQTVFSVGIAEAGFLKQLKERAGKLGTGKPVRN